MGARGPRFWTHAGPGTTEQIDALLAPAVLWLCMSALDSVCCHLVAASFWILVVPLSLQKRELWTPGFTLGWNVAE